MAPNIRVDQEVYDFLKGRAEPFADTPNSVLRRLLNLDGAAMEAETGQGKRAGGRTRRPQTGRQRRTSVSPSRRRSRGRAPRTPAGVLLPEGEYVVPLLSALAERGGSAPVRDVLEAVGQALDGKLTPVDNERNTSGTIRWRNRAQFVRLRLVEEGLMAKDSPRGVWSLTDSGRARLTRDG